MVDMFPIDFELDVVDGLKRIYSEAVLPEPEISRNIAAYNEVNKKHRVGVMETNRKSEKNLYFNFHKGDDTVGKHKKKISKPKHEKIKVNTAPIKKKKLRIKKV